MELDGTTAVVTGGSRGIGRAIAAAFAAREACVAVASRSEDQVRTTIAELEAQGGRVLGVPTDVSDAGQVAALVERVEDEFGPIDVLVNNAGSLTALGPTWELDPERWLRDVTTNLWGTFLCCRTVMPGMVARGRGRIINVVGGGATYPHTYGSGYGCSKAAVLAFTETLAIEAGGTGVAVFAINPGLVRTEMTRFVAESPEGRAWRPEIGRVLQEGRDVPPELAAELCVRLAAGQADALSGRLFRAGSDFDDMLARAEEIVAADALTLRLRDLP
jgi:NAD(P)-dependent dehydrogenase (short-subunit alcohol dehydrogenase family)